VDFGLEDTAMWLTAGGMMVKWRYGRTEVYTQSTQSDINKEKCQKALLLQRFFKKVTSGVNT